MADMLVKERPKQRQENVYLKREVSIPFDATYINDALASQPLSAKTLQVSEELYWERYYEGRGEQDESYEWNNGILEEKAMPTLIQLNLYGWFFKLLQTFLETHPIGDLIFLETAFPTQLALMSRTVPIVESLIYVLKHSQIPSPQKFVEMLMKRNWNIV